MNIKELNKLIKEELDAFLENEDELDSDIEVTTDEPEAEEDPLDLLRQIFDMLKPIVEPEGEMGDEGDMEDMEDMESGEEEEAEDEGGEEEEEVDEEMKAKKKDDVDENLNNLNESRQLRSRFKKLANIIK